MALHADEEWNYRTENNHTSAANAQLSRKDKNEIYIQPTETPKLFFFQGRRKSCCLKECLF